MAWYGMAWHGASLVLIFLCLVSLCVVFYWNFPATSFAAFVAFAPKLVLSMAA